MKNYSINNRIKKFQEYLNITPYEFSKKLGNNRPDGIYKILDNKVEPSPKTVNKIIETFSELNATWLMTGEGQMINNYIPADATELTVSEHHHFDYAENKNSNSFIRLENGQYSMIMPLAEFEIQAGLLDHYQDIEFINELSKHSIIVNKPVRGRYLAFRIKGDSMDDGTSKAIMQGSIVATRELQRQHWTNPIRFRDFPYWVIYTVKSRYPLLKEIISHDTAKGIITCHSLNDAPEYQDFDLHINDIQALFYVVDVNKSVSKKMEY